MNDIDTKIDELEALIKLKREELNAVSRPVWKTNCAFTPGVSLNPASDYHQGRGPGTNIQTADEESLLAIGAQLVAFDNNAQQAIEQFKARGADVKIPVRWAGYPISDWLDDIATALRRRRIKEIQKTIADAEKILAEIVSPEKRRQRDLERAAAMLDGV